jgi:DNA-binding NarL/FixJ family response regulator
MDDNETMRRTLRNVLEGPRPLEVCGEASDGREAVAKFDEEKFDVIVLDFQMPGMNGLDAAKLITSRSPRTPILMVTLHHSPQLAEEARKVGIRGIRPKADIDCVVEGVTTILDNKSYFKNWGWGAGRDPQLHDWVPKYATSIFLISRFYRRVDDPFPALRRRKKTKKDTG